MNIKNVNISNEVLNKFSVEQIADLNLEFNEISEGFNKIINTCDSLLNQ